MQGFIDVLLSLANKHISDQLIVLNIAEITLTASKQLKVSADITTGNVTSSRACKYQKPTHQLHATCAANMVRVLPGHRWLS